MDIKEKRLMEFFDTVKIVSEGSYKFNGNEFVMVPNHPSPSQFYDTEINVDFELLPTYDEKIVVEPVDCLVMAKEKLDEGNRVAVLNMASLTTPGGGVLHGSGAQEENLFRRTNLFKSLYQYKNKLANEFEVERAVKQYPLDENYGGIYSPNVSVFKGTEEDGYRLLEKPYKVNIVSVAAYKDPPLTENGELTDDIKVKIRNKIKTILNICLLNGDDTLILSAFGCGAYCTPPREMAKLFKEILTSEPYKNRFKFVGFAILNDHNAHKAHNPEGNYAPFKEILEN